MPIGITAPEGRAVSGAQCFFPRVGNQRQFAIEYPDEFVLKTVPMTLAGPRTCFDDSHVHAELSQSGETRQPLTGLSDARLIKGFGIRASGLRRHDGNVEFFHSVAYLNEDSNRRRVTAATGRGVTNPESADPAEGCQTQDRPRDMTSTQRDHHRQFAAI